jgi:hypothetical protein
MRSGSWAIFSTSPKARRFTLALNRYRWEAGEPGMASACAPRCRAASVLKAQSKAEARIPSMRWSACSSIAFEEGEAPGGVLDFTFSGGGALRLEVECIDLVLADVSEPWRAAARPRHPEDSAP